MWIGLTGSIGAGKSTVAQMLRELGAQVIDADRVSKELTAKGFLGAAAIREEFGPKFFDHAGNLDRKRLAAYVFQDRARLDRLNAILHPLILEEMYRRAHEMNETPVVFDVPLLIECGMHKRMDCIWVVCAPFGDRLKRIMLRDRCTCDEARARIVQQMSQEEKARFATSVIPNDGTIGELRERVETLYNNALRGIHGEND